MCRAEEHREKNKQKESTERRISGMLSTYMSQKNQCTKNEKVTFHLKYILLYIYNLHVKFYWIWIYMGRWAIL